MTWGANVVGCGSAISDVARCSSQTGHEAVTGVVRCAGVEHILVDHDVHLARTGGCQLTKHDVLGNTTAVVQLTAGSSVQENLDRLFERATHESTRISTVDTVTSNCHDHATSCHDIDKKCQMTVVDVGTVEGQHLSELLEEGRTGSLDTEHLDNLEEVVRVGTACVNSINGQDTGQSGTGGVKEPLSALITLGHVKGAVIPNDLLLTAVDEGTLNTWNTAQGQVVEQPFLQHAKQFFIVLFTFLVLARVVLDQANTDDKLLSIVVAENDCQVLVILLLDPSSDLGYSEALIKKSATVEHDTHEPLGLGVDIFLSVVRDDEVRLNQVGICLNDSRLNVRIIV